MAACGPSKQEQNIAGQQASLASSMATDFQQRFATQTQLLNTLNQSIAPIVAAGPDQQGFSAEELAARNTSAINNVAAANRNAAQAASTSIAGHVSDSGLESGIQQAIKGGIASNSANELAGEQNQITSENYAVGRSKYDKAIAGAQALSGELNPQVFGRQADTGLSSAFGEANTINTQNQALGKDILHGGLALMGGVARGFNNLDTTGSSSGFEQFKNFAEGMA